MGVDDASTTEARFDEFCSELDVDEETKKSAWNAFEEIKDSYYLEGDALHWLLCSIFVDFSEELKEEKIGKAISLTRLLRAAKAKVNFVYPRSRIVNAANPEAEKWKCILLQFFDKMKKWSRMTASSEACSRIERLERNYNVVTVIFNKMRPLFFTVFKAQATGEENVVKRKDRRRRRPQCSVYDLLAFCWTTFVYVKAQYPGIGDDLVNSFHLFLCCLDWLYNACLDSQRTDLLNPSFPPQQRPENRCILKQLCEDTDGVEIEAKVIRQFHWQPTIRELVERNVMQCPPNATHIVADLNNFETNFRALNCAYEKWLMTVGEFDERVFLGEQEPTPSVLVKKEGMDCVDGLQQAPDRSFLQVPSEKANVSNKLLKLRALLARRSTEPSPTLVNNVNASEALQKMQVKIRELSSILRSKYDVDDDVETKVEMTQKLYYKLLENIIQSEKTRLKDKKADFQQLLEKDIFVTSLFSCALQIVLFACESKTKFQWILDIYQLESFHFYKIIESVVKNEEKLSREVVRHLNVIEEDILSNLAWRDESPLWEMIRSENTIPSCEQVTFPNQLEKENGEPLMNEKLTEALRLGSALSNPKRRLFTAQSQNQTGLMTANHIQVSSLSQPEGEPKTFTFQSAVNDEGRRVLIPVQLVPVRKNDRPQYKGATAIFFRKLYHLASLRLRSLCDQLRLDDAIRNKIWTCIEYAIVKHVDLLRNRHLDPVILCCVFVVCRLTDDPRSFQGIINAYRWQPQAKSCIYRDVLIKSGASDEDSENARGDLVQFYNDVFVQKMKKFAVKVAVEESDSITTPLPTARGFNVFSRKLSRKHSIYVSPIKEDREEDTCTKMRYRFDESFPCDLRFINTMLRTTERRAKKRPLQDENENETETEDAHFLKKIKKAVVVEGGSIAPALREKLLGLVRDRQHTLSTDNKK